MRRTLVLAEKEGKKGTHEVKFVLDPAVQKDSAVTVGSNVKVKYHTDANQRIATEKESGRQPPRSPEPQHHKTGAWPRVNLRIRRLESPGVPGPRPSGRGSGALPIPGRPSPTSRRGGGSFSETASYTIMSRR